MPGTMTLKTYWYLLMFVADSRVAALFFVACQGVVATYHDGNMTVLIMSLVTLTVGTRHQSCHHTL